MTHHKRIACKGGAWGAPDLCLAHEGLPLGPDGFCAHGRPQKRAAPATPPAPVRPLEQLGLFPECRWCRGHGAVKAGLPAPPATPGAKPCSACGGSGRSPVTSR